MYMFFFFKQKTAYEMRISDWSSDVCSSDLNLLDDDDRRARRAFGARAIRGEIALAVQRRDRQHLGHPCAPRIRRSWSSSHCLVAGPSPAEYAPKAPPAASTRWHGTTMGKGLREHA